SVVCQAQRPDCSMTQTHSTSMLPHERPVMLDATDFAAEHAGDNASQSVLAPTDTFVHRHIAPDAAEIGQMLELLGVDSLDALIDQTVPESIRLREPMRLTGLSDGRGEFETLCELREIASKNKVYRSFIGMG